MKEKRICLIPARGGSKRIPRKNIKMFHNKPLIAWTIEAAKRSKIFDDIFVSTDSEKIKKIALSYGAGVPFMRDKYFDNKSPDPSSVSNEVLAADSSSVDISLIVAFSISFNSLI